jgi:hypothetical protein
LPSEILHTNQYLHFNVYIIQYILSFEFYSDLRLMKLSKWEKDFKAWQCGCGCFSNNFSYWNACQWCFFIFKNYFWHQHIKTIQNILNFSKKQLIFFGNAVCTAFPNGVLISRPFFNQIPKLFFPRMAS